MRPMPAYSVTFDWGFAPNFGEDGSTYSETYNYEVMSNGTYWLGDVPTPNRSGQTFPWMVHCNPEIP